MILEVVSSIKIRKWLAYVILISVTKRIKTVWLIIQYKKYITVNVETVIIIEAVNFYDVKKMTNIA